MLDTSSRKYRILVVDDERRMVGFIGHFGARRF